MAKKTCAYCKTKRDESEMFVKHAGKHNTYYCNEEEFQLAIKRKKLREENKKLREGLTVQN